MCCPKVGDRVRVLSNRNGAYKDLEGTIVKLESGGNIRVTFDSKWEEFLDDMGYLSKYAFVSKGTFCIVRRTIKDCIEVE